MAHYAFIAPLKPDMTEAWRDRMQEMTTTRGDDFRASRERMGLEKEEVWLQHTPMGDFAVVYLEADDVDGVFADMMSSQDPFDAWFRENVLIAAHGMDPSMPLPTNEQVLGRP
jgi:hypothetical protein